MFTKDLSKAVNNTDEEAKSNALKDLYDKYVSVHDLEENLKDINETINRQTRQRKHLQHSVILLQRQVNQQQEITVKHYTSKSAENSALLNDLNRLQKENRILKKRLANAKSDVEMLESNLKRFRHTNNEQKIRQARLMKSPLGGQEQKQKVVGEWVKQKTRVGTSSVSVVDSRGRYWH